MSPTTTRALLAGGVVAGPLYMGIGVIEILIRPGFDISRHELSLMSIGDLGWIQIASFRLLVCSSSVARPACDKLCGLAAAGHGDPC